MKCKHEAGLSDFVQILQDKQFANITHYLMRCKYCGKLVVYEFGELVLFDTDGYEISQKAVV